MFAEVLFVGHHARDVGGSLMHERGQERARHYTARNSHDLLGV